MSPAHLLHHFLQIRQVAEDWIAVVNFVNLSTAQSSKRGKEVGVRKALGAYRLPLLIQSMSESVILCAVSLALGLCHILGSL